MDSGAAVVVAVGLGAALLVLLVVLPLAITHGSHQIRELEDAWRKLAERHHLRCERSSRFKLPTVSGELGGRPLLIKRESGNDSSPTRVQLTLHGPLPDGFHIGAPQPQLAVFGHVVTGDALTTGDATFDEAVAVKGDDPDAIRQYLTAGRKRAAAQAVELGGELEDGVLTVAVNRKDADLESLDRLLQDLEETAAVLDVA